MRIHPCYMEAKVGVSVIITRGDQLLLSLRKCGLGAGTWDTPGGHVERGEKIIECALRETEEETAQKLDPAKIRELGFTEDFFEYEMKHYISCVLAIEIQNELFQPKLSEPDKFSTDWIWFKHSELPSPLFLPVQNALDKFKGNIWSTVYLNK